MLAFTLSLLLLQALPGEPLDRLDSPRIGAREAERSRAALGLDRSFPVMWWQTLRSYASGELGFSFTRGEAVGAVLGRALGPTAALGAATLVVAYLLGIALASLYLGSPRHVARLDAGLLVLATPPTFVFGAVLLQLLHFEFPLFPASHAAYSAEASLGERMSHLVLPTLSLALPAAARIARLQGAVLSRDRTRAHLLGARARGVGRLSYAWNHGLRPALSPILTLVGLDLPLLVSGAVVAETLFAWPGLGRLTATAVLEQDYPLALAAIVLTAVAVVVGRRLATRFAALAAGGNP